MRIIIWEKNSLQADILKDAFQAMGHQVTSVQIYSELRHCLTPYLYQPLVIVLNSHALDHLRQIRRLHLYAPLAGILVICAQQDKQSHLDLLHAGADQLVLLPYDFAFLLAKTEALFAHSQRILNAKSNAQPRQESIGGFYFDFSSFALGFQNQSLVLKKREFLLFHYLMLHPNQIHSRQKLYQQIWQGKFSAESRQIDNLVVSLRKRLPKNAVLINSVYGEGYLLQLL